MRKLHVISTGRQTPGQVAHIVRAIAPYVDVFHLREKHLAARDLYTLGQTLLLEADLPPYKLAINDRLDVAIALGAGTVHLAGHSLPPDIARRVAPDMRIGVSVHSLEEAQTAQAAGADYLLFGHVFPSGSKVGLAPRGIEALRTVADACTIPVLALGGITPAVLPDVIESGAMGAAVLSAVMDATQPAEITRQLYTILRQGVNDYDNI
ncbi:thiazole tautomerase (transcriptional regulator TenI) [Aneurinibacillus soli]|uniref:Thiamine-phosphate synthase n=1 Tax=Aneurinibacillus soli TaxID=1500254 RepID=A0A0U5BMI8_9BACL|nr:thiamine phosphate synthase [Aneurinibacillus soli]PYE59872.1 thiazole tautomerase (transcriptional regulator TenI) [Aneurinibacillus soli]BAU29406.1 Regulatory protein TenI [Aneurinibacillus soli]